MGKIKMKNRFTYDDKILEIRFSNKIEFVTSNFLSEVLIETYSKEIKQLILNLSDTRFITLPAAIFILCFSSFLRKNKNPYIDTRIIINSESLITYFINLGFFTQMNVYANLLISKDILENESTLKKRKNTKKKKSTVSSIIFPLSTIPESLGERYFEDYSRTFVNHFNDFFFELCNTPSFGFTNDINESQELFGALHENIKNVYNHSKSLGFGAIHSSISQRGTIIAFFDCGIGIINSVLESGKYKDEEERVNAILWALKDGNSCQGNNGNQGLGFSIIKNFVKNKKGMLTIRTDKYLINIKGGAMMPPKEVGFFPGTQIVIYVPINIH